MKFERIYYKLPVTTQHIAISVQGFILRRQRYSKYTWSRFNQFMESQFWKKEQFEEYQLYQLQQIVSRAAQYSPYYYDLYKRYKVDASLLKSLEDIRFLPIVSKEEFRRNNDKFVCVDIDCRRSPVTYTSGTTGTPIKTYFAPESIYVRFALLERFYYWYNPKPWRRRASFTGRLVVNPAIRRPPYHRKNIFLNQQLYSSHHLEPGCLDFYINELARFKPEQIDGICSPIYVVADHIIRTNRIGLVNPKVVIPTSETLLPHIRERMAIAFGCKVANLYGSQEGAPIAYECPDGGFHTCPESGIFEILRPDGTPCEPGEVGRLVVTSFTSQATPLIRYDIGDLASWRAGDCICGRKMPMLETVYGRVDDVFITTERGIVPRVDSAFKGLPNSIVAAQIAQVELDKFELRLVPDHTTFKPVHVDILVNNLHKYLGERVKIEVKIVSQIPRTKSGKIRAMVNEWQDAMVQNATLASWNRYNGV